MSLKNDMKKALYFTIGAVAVGVDTVAEVTEELLKKSDTVVKKSKKVFKDTCEEKKRSRD